MLVVVIAAACLSVVPAPVPSGLSRLLDRKKGYPVANNRIQNAVEESIQEAVGSALFAIKFNIERVFGGLLYSLKLELEKQGHIGDIDNLVRIIVDSTHYAGPDDESYPAWDEKNKQAREIMKHLEDALQAHGIEQGWNIGRPKQRIKT